MVEEDGDIFMGSHDPCFGCPPVDSLIWTPAPCGNILASSGRAGDKVITVRALSGACDRLLAVTSAGYILQGAEYQCFGAALEGHSVFAALGRPQGVIVGAGADAGSTLYLISESLELFGVGVSGGFLTPTYLGRLPGSIPTNVGTSSWGSLKSRYR